MSRKVITLNDFSGGLCDDPDPRDLRDNELKTAEGISVSRRGKIEVIGDFESDSWGSVVNEVNAIRPGYGYYTFSGDYTFTGDLANTDYIAIAGKTNTNAAVVQIFESDKTKWTATDGSDEIVINSGTTKPFYPVFSYIDGALRISDGNLDSTGSTSKWFGFIDRKLWDDDSSVYNLSNWYATDGIISPSTANGNNSIRLWYSSNLNTKVAGGGAWGTGFAALGAIAIEVQPSSDSGNWTNDHALLMSYIYDDNQESFPTAPGAPNLIFHSSGTMKRFKLQVIVKKSGVFAVNPRLTGVGLYTLPTLPSTGQTIDAGDLRYIGQIDFNREAGIKLDLSSHHYRGWSHSATLTGDDTGMAIATMIGYTTSPDDFVETYETRTGITGDVYKRSGEKPYVDQYKTIAFANRVAYIGNAKDPRTSKIFADSIFKSIPNKFDIISTNRRLDVVVGDGDEVVKLESYADRLLQFKKRKLYIINIAQDVEFLEGEYDYLGVKHPFQVSRTEYGIAWLNERGVYLYNGERIIDLFLDPRDLTRRKINLTNWNSFINIDQASIGYDSKTKKLIITSAISNDTEDIMCYDFVTGSWTKGSNKFAHRPTWNGTNLVTDFNGKVSLYEDGDKKIFTWEDNSTNHTSTLVFETKDIDFGAPGIKKNLYKVFVTHKNATTKEYMKYRINGSTSLYDFTTNAFMQKTSWVTQEFVPSTPLSNNHDINSVSFYISSSSNVDDEFEINDFTIIYRPKGLR